MNQRMRIQQLRAKLAVKRKEPTLGYLEGPWPCKLQTLCGSGLLSSVSMA